MQDDSANGQAGVSQDLREKATLPVEIASSAQATQPIPASIVANLMRGKRSSTPEEQRFAIGSIVGASEWDT